MALTRYTPRMPPALNLRNYIYEELRSIQVVLSVIAEESGVTRNIPITTPIEIGPPDSAGPGYRVLKIPN